VSRLEELPFMTAFLSHRKQNEEQDAANALTTQAKVYAAMTRLQSSMDQADSLEAIREIAANLMGCEEIALYKVDEARAAIWLYWSFGIDPNKHSYFDILHEPKLEQVIAGKIVYRSGAENLLSGPTPATAIVPVISSGQARGVLILFRMLPQRTGIDSADRQICEVLSNCAGRALGPA
jgi:hypothetical protein